MFATGSINDPFDTGNTVRSVFRPNEDRGRARRDPRLVPGENTGVFIIAGQSNASNHVALPLYTPTNSSKVDNLSIYDGGLYAAADPMLGCDNVLGNWIGRFADNLISGGIFQRVILIPVGIGGTIVAWWEPTSILGKLVEAAFARCSALGLPVSAVLWQQGESDGAVGTSKTAYKLSLQALIDRQRALGYNSKWLIGKSTLGSNISYSAIRDACAEVVNGTDILVGADTDGLSGATYRYDGTHFTVAGAIAAAALWSAAVDAAF